MVITWDEAKRLANIDKHGVDFAESTLGFFETSLVIPARSPRYKAVGRMNDRILVVVFAPLGTEAVSIVSVRAASKAERKLFDERQASL